jgi:outer membrane protein assembly factor BamD (BamD/ComL family)
VARDRLSDHEFTVGLTYYRIRNYAGAESRFQTVLTEDPGYTHTDKVFYYLAEMLYKAKRPKEALPLYARVVKDYPKSDMLKKAQKRVAELTR